MIKRSVKSEEDGLQPPLLLVRPTPFWKTRKFIFGTLLGTLAAVIYVELAYWLFWGELPALWQRLLGLVYVSLAVAVYVVVTRQTESTEEMLHRIKRGQHSDFGKRLRKAQEKRTTVKLPLLGETSLRVLGGVGLCVVASAWWLSPLTPVRVKEVVVEDLTAPLGEELVAVVLAMSDENAAVVQPPVLPDHTREIAALIEDDETNLYQRGLKAVAYGRFEEARNLLAGAMRHDDAPSEAIHLARALNEMYAGRFGDATTWYRNAVDASTNDPALLCQMAVAWLQSGEFDKAEPLITRAMGACRAETSTEEDPTALAVCLHLQAVLYVCQGKKYDKAAALCSQAKNMVRDASSNHPVEAASLNTQALVYLLLLRYPSAEGLCRAANDAWTRARGPNHPHVATGLCNRAMLYCNLGWYAADQDREEAPDERSEGAQELLGRACASHAESLADSHPVLAFGCNGRAVVELALGRSETALPLAEKALAITTKALGSEHPSLVPLLDTLAAIYIDRARYTKAELYYNRAVAIAESKWGDHPYTATILNHQADFFISQERYEDAEIPSQRALEIYTQAFGEKHLGVAAALMTRGRLALAAGEPHQARSDFEEALEIRRKAFDKEHPELARHRVVACTLAALASLDNSSRYYTRGVDRYKQAIEMADELLGLEHSEVARLLAGLAALHIRMGKFEEAEPCLQRAWTIREAALVSYHPDLAATLQAYAAVLRKIKPSESERADEMEARAKEIRAEHAEADRPE